MGTRVKKNRRIANRVKKYIWVDYSITESCRDTRTFKTHKEAIDFAQER